MNAAVEILAPTDPDKVKKVLEGIGNTLVVEKPSKARRERILVGWVSDLGLRNRRKELEQLVDIVVKGPQGVPFILIEAKSKRPMNYQSLEKLTRWGCLSGFYLAPELDSVRRIVQARKAGAEDKLIASASIDDGKLVVWSCEPKRYVVALSEIPALSELSAKDAAKFSLSESGSRLHWDKGDIDLDLESIRYYADPKAKKALDKARRADAARYADAIRSLREEQGLNQSDIPGLTDRQVRRIEQGENTPQSVTLAKLAAAHGLGLDEYMSELAKRSKQEATAA